MTPTDVVETGYQKAVSRMRIAKPMFKALNRPKAIGDCTRCPLLPLVRHCARVIGITELMLDEERHYCGLICEQTKTGEEVRDQYRACEVVALELQARLHEPMTVALLQKVVETYITYCPNTHAGEPPVVALAWVRKEMTELFTKSQELKVSAVSCHTRSLAQAKS